MFHTPYEPLELSLAVVGLAYPNTDKAGSSRQFEARLCAPGDPVTLVPDPKNAFDPDAVAVFSERAIQLGFLTWDRCGFIGAKLKAGLPVRAVFQSLSGNVAVVRARIGGGSPTLPVPPQASEAACDDGFYPDPPAPEWGA